MDKKGYWTMLKETYAAWSRDRVMTQAAALAYYGIFCIAPLLLIAVAIVGVVYGQGSAQHHLRVELSRLLPAATVKPIMAMVAKARSSMGAGVWQITLGVLFLIYAATTLFSALQEALNTVWHVEAKPGRGVKGVLQDRLPTFLFVLVVAALLLASIFSEPIISGMGHRVFNLSPLALQIINILVCIVVFTGIFAALFRILPDAEIRWKDVLIGAGVTAVLFTLGRWILGYVVARSSTSSVYGATGSLVILLLFIYYSSILMLFGAEFTKVYAQRDGTPIVPSKNAQHIRVFKPEGEHEGQGPGATAGATAGPATRPARPGFTGEHASRRTAATAAPVAHGTPAYVSIAAREDGPMKYPADRYNVPFVHGKVKRRNKKRRMALASGVIALAPLALLIKRHT